MRLLGEGEGGGGGKVRERGATAGIQEPQGGDGLRRGKWNTLDSAEIARSKDTRGQGEELCRNLSALFYLHLANWSFLSLKIMILAVILRKKLLS